MGLDLVKAPWGYRFLGSVDDFVYADDKLRPTWQRKRSYLFPDEHRRQLCVHLAAHAAVSNMGGAYIYMMAVAPAGVRSWTISERKAREIGEMWGICSTSDFYCRQLNWDEDRQMYGADREHWECELKQMHDHMAQFERENGWSAERRATYGVGLKDEFLESHRRVVRAQICGYLAGHIADGITAGMEAEDALLLYDRRDTQYVGGVSDIVIAEGLAGLLPPGEYENAVRITEEVLRRPEVWESVNLLAEDLQKFGLLENDDCEADIAERLPRGVGNWPPAPVQPSAAHIRRRRR